MQFFDDFLPVSGDVFHKGESMMRLKEIQETKSCYLILVLWDPDLAGFEALFDLLLLELHSVFDQLL